MFRLAGAHTRPSAIREMPAAALSVRAAAGQPPCGGGGVRPNTRRDADVAVSGPICSDRRVPMKPRPHAADRTVLRPEERASEPASESLSGRRIDSLFREHSAYVARLAYRLLGREDEVDDVVQDVFIKLFANLAVIREAAAVRGWLATTTIRMVGRRLRLRRIGFLLGIGARVDPADLQARGASAEDHAALMGIHRALAGVPVGPKLAWILRHVEEERIEDVARLCGCSLATAKRRIAAAHVVVRQAVGDGRDE